MLVRMLRQEALVCLLISMDLVDESEQTVKNGGATFLEVSLSLEALFFGDDLAVQSVLGRPVAHMPLQVIQGRVVGWLAPTVALSLPLELSLELYLVEVVSDESLRHAKGLLDLALGFLASLLFDLELLVARLQVIDRCLFALGLLGPRLAALRKVGLLPGNHHLL